MIDRQRGRITYEPFLFGLAVLGVMYKIYRSLREHELRFDWMLAAVILVFLVACGLWVFNSRRPKPSSRIDVSLETENVRNSQVVGAESQSKDSVRADIKTKDVENSQIVGFREK
jgi:hypothetical protein